MKKISLIALLGLDLRTSVFGSGSELVDYSSNSCQVVLDDYCNNPKNCLDSVHGRFSGPLVAAHSGPGSPQWRCYAINDLNKDRTQYVSGSEYCTRNTELISINAQPPCNGTIPPSPAPTPSHDLPSVPVFTKGLGNVSCYRIPAIVQTMDGSTLVAFAEARHTSCGDGEVHEIATRRSTDGGTTWSDLGFAVGNSSYMVGNPTAVALANGSIAMIYVKHSPKCTGDCGTGNALVLSHDAGISWSSPHDISQDFGSASGSLPGPGTALQISGGAYDGRLLVISHQGAYHGDWVSHSDDGGKTWITGSKWLLSMDEAALTQLSNGSIMANMRHTSSPKVGRGIAISNDGGETFGPIHFDAELISPVCQASIVSFNGKTFFSNPATTNSRSHTTIRRSSDNAQTWEASLLVHEGSSAGYSCLVKGELGAAVDASNVRTSGEGGILYESADEMISFSRFPLDFKN